jgi:proteasome lid subunit RPN8/RPN11
MPIASTLAQAARPRNFPMLQIAQSAFDRLRAHGESAYPEESCGVLLGTVSGGERIVLEAVPLANIAETRRNRYRIAPVELIRAEKAARQAGREILGFYHSHPDHPAEPSATDLAEAHWLGYSYVITAVLSGGAMVTQSFRLCGSSEEDKHFEAETQQPASLPEPSADEANRD